MMPEQEQRLGGRALVADDHPLTREGLSLAARAALPGVSVVAVGTVSEASEAAARGPFRIILLDFHLPDANGFSGLLTLQMHAPRTPVVLVTASEEPSLVEAARALGAAGYLFKSLPLDALAERLRRIDSGQTAFPPISGAAPQLGDLRARIETLSPAQRGVLIALADGRSNKQLARDLDVTEATIKAHMTAIFRKLGVTNRAQAMLAVQPLLGATPK
ncbi:response regulator transcription factor [Sphingomonas sp. BK345]|uniref:response regulator transcription factor n=2 Tax=unclassified Sphingomonas TaxID=196159 RepID=UPI00184AE695|nr:response regulator transcription factor [Sphingomonas sp. BK345]MBB3474852.1 DNA-binding NarL/FixJ family response regulator [Sphingomonas sp. BK345]